MHEAYQVSQLLKLTVQIESTAAYGKYYNIILNVLKRNIYHFNCIDENLLVGTRQGHLLMYRVVPTPDDKHDVQLMRYNKTFSKKAIQQLDVIPEYHLLVSLTG